MLERMTDTMTHRGPDERGFFRSGPIGLGHRRLSIIDLRDGRQPMASADQSTHLVFNGEIYNHMEWRKTLQAAGRPFKTDHSDTETLLQLYEQYGPDCVHKLNGMFAFVIWDEKRKRLFAARDRLGIKPLYYVQRPGILILASEIKALLACPQVSHQIDPVALYEYLALRYVPAPRTLFEGIQKLPAGHSLFFDNGQLRVERYWDVPWGQHPETLSENAWADKYLSLLEDSVRIRLLSDVPLGAFLSGGLDSTTLVALMKRLTGSTLHTYSIGFGNKPGDAQSWDERPYSRLAARTLGTTHKEFVVDASVCDHMRKLVWHMDEPIADPAALPTYVLSRETRREVTVAISGEGSDETLGGYGKYAFPHYQQLLSPALRWINPRYFLGLVDALPIHALKKQRLEKFLKALALPPGAEQALVLLAALHPDRVDELLTGDALKTSGRRQTLDVFDAYLKDSHTLDPLSRLLHVEIKTYLAEQLLMKVDKMSMAASLEVRVPFLDYRLVELAAQIPSSLKVRGRSTKVILKNATRGLVPEAIRTRPKQGFSVPVESWYRGPLRKSVESLVDFARGDGGVFLDAQGVERAVQRQLVDNVYQGQELWSLLILKEWFYEFAS